jgi:hypothetical protein
MKQGSEQMRGANNILADLGYALNAAYPKPQEAKQKPKPAYKGDSPLYYYAERYAHEAQREIAKYGYEWYAQAIHAWLDCGRVAYCLDRNYPFNALVDRHKNPLDYRYNALIGGRKAYCFGDMSFSLEFGDFCERLRDLGIPAAIVGSIGIREGD